MLAGGVRRGWLGRVGLRDLGGEPEVGEDGADDVWVLDRRDETEATATPGTGQHVDVEGVTHQMGLRPVARCRARPRSLGDLRGRGLATRVGFRIAEGHDPGTPAGMRREDAVVQDEVYVRAGDQSGELFEELQGLEDQVAGAVGLRGLEREPDAAVGGEPEAVLGHGRA